MNRPIAQHDLQINGANRPFFYRSDSAADRGVIEQIFQNGDYRLSNFSLSDPLLRLYLSVNASGRTPLIVDAGANIGASVVYFAGIFPKSRILAIEPEKNNCALLRRNCAGLNYELLEGGVGSAAGNLYLNDPGKGDWSFRLDTHGEYLVPVFAAASIVADETARGMAPFIFKIDIEGGEERAVPGRHVVGARVSAANHRIARLAISGNRQLEKFPARHLVLQFRLRIPRRERLLLQQ